MRFAVQRVSRKRRRQWAKEALNEDEYIAELDARSGVTTAETTAKVTACHETTQQCCLLTSAVLSLVRASRWR